MTTSAKGVGGGDATERARGTGRAAILENVAGGLWCLDKAAYGAAPENCATQAGGPISAPTTDRFVYQPPIPHR